MADSKIKLDLELKKEAAQRALSEFEDNARDALQNLQKARDQLLKSRTKENYQAYYNASNAYKSALGSVQSGQNQVAKIEARIDEEEARRGGKIFGRAVSKTTESMVKDLALGYFGKNVLDTVFETADNPIHGKSSGAQVAEAGINGAMQGAAIGFAAGGPIGAVIGGAGGAVIEWWRLVDRNKKKRQKEDWDLMNAETDRNRQFMYSTSKYAFDELSSSMSRGEMLKAKRERLKDMWQGKDSLGNYKENSVLARQDAFNAFNRTKYIGTAAYERNKSLLEESLSNYQSEAQEYLQAFVSNDIRQFRNAGDYNSDLAKQGIYTAFDENQFDWEKANEPILRDLADIRGLLQRIAGLKGESPENAWETVQAINEFIKKKSGTFQP